MNIDFDLLTSICPYCQLKHRDGEWLDACDHPNFFVEGDDTPKCLEQTCPLNENYDNRREN